MIYLCEMYDFEATILRAWRGRIRYCPGEAIFISVILSFKRKKKGGGESKLTLGLFAAFNSEVNPNSMWK